MKARRIGRGKWLAHCVAHPDRHASLQIREGDKGILLKCWSQGCDPKAICAALGLRVTDLFYASELASSRKREMETRCRLVKPVTASEAKRKPLGKLVATYTYTDERGNLLAEKLRYEGKVFLWRRPDGNGGWIWKVPKDIRPLYHLNEVVSAQLVGVCEGEKDADRLRSEGMVATTAPDGSNSWRPEFGTCFSGKKVYIFPDSDAPGEAYAKNAALSIVPYAKRVRIVRLPAKDLSDFLDSHSITELGNLIRRVK